MQLASGTLLPPGDGAAGAQVLSHLQALCADWGAERFASAHQLLARTTLLDERRALVQLAPGVPIGLLHTLAEVLKMPLVECEQLRRWLVASPPKRVVSAAAAAAADATA